jgi:hypothetical protein
MSDNDHLPYCAQCGQPMLPTGKRRESPDDYRHARGCPSASPSERKRTEKIWRELEPQSWELRRRLRHGSERIDFFPTREEAEKFARKNIEHAGNVGRIESVIGHTVYYDIHAEDE